MHSIRFLIFKLRAKFGGRYIYISFQFVKLGVTMITKYNVTNSISLLRKPIFNLERVLDADFLHITPRIKMK